MKELHRRGIEQYGGSHGVRDEGMIESVVMAAQASFDGRLLNGSIADMAAAYWYGLCRNHGFIDGNKRVALRSAHNFILMNGFHLEMNSDEAVEITLRIAQDELSKSELAEIINDRLRPYLS